MNVLINFHDMLLMHKLETNINLYWIRIWKEEKVNTMTSCENLTSAECCLLIK